MRKVKILIVLLIIFFFPKLNMAEGFLRADGTNIVNGSGENYLLRGIGTGNWMIMEGYMMKTSGAAGTQHEIKDRLIAEIGEEQTNLFFDTWLANHFTRTDVDSMKAWGFNSVRVAMHYLWFTPPIEEEPIGGEITWLNKGFEMMDSLLDWCGDNEMYLILDMHGTPGGQGTNADISDYDPSKPSLWESIDNQNKLAALWYKLAERYNNEPWLGGYDLINETNWDFENNPSDDSGWSNTKNIPLLNMHKRLIDTIRTVDNNHMVFVSGNSWGNNYNGMNSLASYDDNLAYTFHKYWNTNTNGDLDWIKEKRDALNVPLWMSESGENSNTWFTDAIALFEKNNIGWSWWPVKKEGINNVIKVKMPETYDTLLKVWKNEINQKLSPGQTFQAVMDWAENHKIENCEIKYDVIDAMMRQPHTDEILPFKNHTVDDTLFLTDYDYGKNGFAYFDTDVADYHSSGQDYTAWNAGWGYRNDGVDIEPCTDDGTNGYSVGWTATDEWMLYTLTVDSTAAFNLDIRYAADGSSGKFHLELDENAITPVTSLAATGGWSTWSTQTLEGVVLTPGTHKLKLYVDHSGFNINYLHFYNPQNLRTVNAEILKFSTDSLGTQIILQSNLGFDKSQLPAIENFKFRISNNVQEIKSIEFDDAKPLNLLLNIDTELTQIDKVYLSYSGTDLIGPNGQQYNTFEDVRVTNKAPFFFVLPMKIQAENYTVNEGFVLEDCTDTGGGQNLSYANAGDFTEYEVILHEADDFVFSYRAASQGSGRFKMQTLIDGETTDLHTISVSTGGWQTWKTYTEKASLPAGKYVLRIVAVSGEYNLNWFDLDIDTWNDVLTENDLSMFCFNKILTISGVSESIGNTNVEVYNTSGQKVFAKAVVGDESNELDLTNLKNGIYICKASNGKAVQTKRIRIE